MKNSNLFSPFIFPNGKRVKNRISVAPMTNMLSADNGEVSELDIQWLQRFKGGGFGTVITPASYVSKSGQGWPNQLGIHDDSLQSGLNTLGNALLSEDGLNIVQIAHNGGRSPSSVTGEQPLSASSYSLDLPDFEQPKALSVNDINEIKQNYVSAAVRAYRAGFDGVELHFANGYLITQFLSTTTNLRQDMYGGNLENRARYAREIVQACRTKLPDDFLIGARLSPEGDGLDIDEAIITSQWLVNDGLDFIHLSQLEAAAPATKYAEQKNPVVSYFREALGDSFPIFVAGGIFSGEIASGLIDAGASFVALGRTAIGNPDWPLLIKQSLQPTPYPYKSKELLEKGAPQEIIDYCNNYIPFLGVISEE
ncbi:NADH:flavin oxidoreductase [Vibrio sp. S4M6]|uniref:NADH:flavin oxidoreductase n=1 Tax=Vibrio sinus TaxID=2946865 RepID=UPI002029E978|nr:NADH:flavin oxidoreductase [Vibrio sinus]MCL9783346.1 NADH:flavin oxidoreductase [Vibrio sinus]